ncbi:DUF4861 family protein [Pedobacter deserti]|uniref:DUF4861 family protein n=1 Tax=Pedobacter deserti TaxID=2817382 RepID=UPI002108AD6B|nr:DUF4861 family protein [Pedobacter sp. SYSU D00382]
MRNSILVFLLLAGSLSSVLGQKKTEGIQISLGGYDNMTYNHMKNYTFSVDWAYIMQEFPELRVGNFKVIDVQTGKEIAYQLEYRGQKAVQNLLVQITPKTDITVHGIRLVPGKPALFSSRVYGRYVPERKDDFAWENDRIAFRMYGKALESTNENAYGIDVWSKRNDSMVIDKWYKTGDYHKDHGLGLDYYSVGYTLGGGDIAPVVGDKIYFPKNYRNWKILDKGPIRFTFQLDYDEWDVAGRKVKVSKLISLDAGAQLNRIEATFTFAGTEPLPVAIGIVKRKEPGHIVLDERSGLMSYWEPAHGQDGILGLGTLLFNKSGLMKVSATHLLTETYVESGKPVIYYSGAVWNKASSPKISAFQSEANWNNYLRDFANAMRSDVLIGIK